MNSTKLLLLPIRRVGGLYHHEADVKTFINLIAKLIPTGRYDHKTDNPMQALLTNGMR